MAILSREFIGNRGGIGVFNATQTDAGSATTNAIYTLPNHVFRVLGAIGIAIVNFNEATAATVTGINMTVNGATLPLTNNNDETLTTLTAGLHILLFDKLSNKLLVIV